jgi:hypothetical protein
VVIMELLRNHDSEGPHLLMSSSLIDAVRTHLPADLDLPACLDTEQQRDLLRALGVVPDPRRRRGVRYRLASLLAVAVCAVLAGACTFAAIADWAADLDPPARAPAGPARPGSGCQHGVAVPGPPRRHRVAGGADRLATRPAARRAGGIQALRTGW